MIEHAKIDDKEFVFINRKPTKEEEKAFNEFMLREKEKVRDDRVYEKAVKEMTAVREPQTLYGRAASTQRIRRRAAKINRKAKKPDY